MRQPHEHIGADRNSIGNPLETKPPAGARRGRGLV